ncbi:CBS domain-containing protein [Catelliglobosispora koreensis]|uniref:CBS domain-containing protein n=1 Tax=Catelliglobosispora koreensis TaxID=129052 RepID=UPI000360EC63|nr:CBS domain-containing protein [Catelliglobosispora koreensis]
MRAADLAVEYPTVTMSTPAFEAARILARGDLPGLIVVDDAGKPLVVLPGTQVLRLAVPSYIQDDPTLARVIDEAAADVFIRELDGRTVQECLPDEPKEPPIVDSRATALEMSALMARTRSPLVAVTNPDGTLAGAVTMHALLDRIIGDGESA